MGMYEIRRGLAMALGAAAAGGIVWAAGAYADRGATGGYWATLGIVAGGGLVLTLVALLSGRPQGGGPRFSPGTFLLAFVPAVVVVAWIVVALEPHGNTARDHLLNWSGDIGIRDVVTDFRGLVPVLAFGLGSLLGFSLAGAPARPPELAPANAADERAADEALTAETEYETGQTRVG
jgi:hypothetical protein